MDEREDTTTAKKKNAKGFWTTIAVVLGVPLALVVICVCVYCYRNKPAKLVQTADLDGANSAKGEIVDYRYAYVAAQDEEFNPPEENGWRLILQALGPRALEEARLANVVPWEEFPTNDLSKEWFNGLWTKLCEKFHLDPHERPTMLDRMDLWNYVGKNGLVGDEPAPDMIIADATYNENGEEHPAKIDSSRALETLTAKPWTAEDYPVAARWLEENADFFDLLANAARSPKLGCWHFAAELEYGGFLGTLLPDVMSTREFARLLQVRACYRVGSGNLSGAIDDVETITLFGRALLEHKTGTLVERVMGISCLEIALSVPLFENADVAPTQEELARVAELRASLYQNGQVEKYVRLAFTGERMTIGYGGYADFLAARRLGGHAWDFFIDMATLDYQTEALVWLFIYAPPVNDAKSLQIFMDLYDSAVINNPDKLLQGIRGLTLLSLLTQSPEKNCAYFAASFLLPNPESIEEAFSKMECAAKIGTITTALYAYRTEHGTLPPAFTVDENGKPLQSWRVLILPYLGDDAKALYEKIRLDEPWDSEYNSAFHAQLPDVYRCPSAAALNKDETALYAKEDETVYSILLGDDGLFDESGAGRDFIEVATRPDRDVWNQLLVVERDEPVCWMRPDQELRIADFTVGGITVVNKFFDSLWHKDGINSSAPSGSARFLPSTTTDSSLEAFLVGARQPEKEKDDEDPDNAPAEAPVAESPNANDP